MSLERSILDSTGGSPISEGNHLPSDGSKLDSQQCRSVSQEIMHPSIWNFFAASDVDLTVSLDSNVESRFFKSSTVDS